MSPELTTVVRALKGKRFSLENEKRTQEDIYAVLVEAFDFMPGMGSARVRREVKIAGGTIDFTADMGRIGIEVKLKGSAGEIQRQLRRYAGDGRIEELVFVTAKPVGIPEWIGGKRCVVVDLGSAWL